MKRQTQLAGVRRWYGDDLLELQSEPLKALDGVFGAFGPCIISGCNISADGSKHNISSGLVALQGTGPDGATERMVIPFAGATSVVLPVYLSLAYETTTGQYDDGEVKPVSYGYYAKVTSVVPEGEHIPITASGGTRYVDVIQDAGHRFITDSERTVWNDKETPEGAQTKANVAIAEAKGYTDTREEATRTDFDGTLLQFITDAIRYIDNTKSEILGDVPADMNSLQKIASALNSKQNSYIVRITNFDTFDVTSPFTDDITGKKFSLEIGESCQFRSSKATGMPTMGPSSTGSSNDVFFGSEYWSGTITRINSSQYALLAYGSNNKGTSKGPFMASRLYRGIGGTSAWVVLTDYIVSSSNGFVKFPSGMMIQWGDIDTRSNTDRYRLTFPYAFTSLYSFVATPHSLYPKTNYSIHIYAYGITSVDVICTETVDGVTTLSTVGFKWIAIGKWD